MVEIWVFRWPHIYHDRWRVELERNVKSSCRALFQCRGVRGPAPLSIIDTKPPMVLLNGWVQSLVLEEELFDVNATVGDPSRWHPLLLCSGGTQIKRIATLDSIASSHVPGGSMCVS